MNECMNCGCYDPDREGCTMPSIDRSYACPIEGEEEAKMTYQDIKEHCERTMKTVNPESKTFAEHKMVKELIEKAEKYRWHDLRKNPEDLPEEHETMFAKYYGTEKWRQGMFRKASDAVDVTYELSDGKYKAGSAHTIDGTFTSDTVKMNLGKVIAWRHIGLFEEGEEE